MITSISPSVTILEKKIYTKREQMGKMKKNNWIPWHDTRTSTSDLTERPKADGNA